MKKLVALALMSLLATSAFAIVDEDEDMMGLYFDMNADVVCGTAAFLDHVPMYIMYTNPTLANIRGFECGITINGAANSSLTVASYPVPSTDVGSGLNRICGYSVPVPTTPAMVLCTLDLFYLDFNPLDFFLGASEPSSNSEGLPMVMLEDFSLMTVGTSVLEGPAAQLNAPECAVVDNEDASFGAVKALFR